MERERDESKSKNKCSPLGFFENLFGTMSNRKTFKISSFSLNNNIIYDGLVDTRRIGKRVKYIVCMIVKKAVFNKVFLIINN